MNNNILIGVNVFCLLVVALLYGEQRFLAEPRLSALEQSSLSQRKALTELELRQTNSLQYLESRIGRTESKLDATTNELRHSLKMLELRQSALR